MGHLKPPEDEPIPSASGSESGNTGSYYETRGYVERIERKPEHIYTVTFKKKPMGMQIDSDENEYCAYVTGYEGNSADKPPVLYSKVKSVMGVDVENREIDAITEEITKVKCPIQIEFIHPDGLQSTEYPDDNPEQRLDKTDTAHQNG